MIYTKGKFKGSKFEGEFINGKVYGQGKFYDADGTLFVGSYVNSRREGFGIETFTNGSYYEGNYKKGKRHGKGKLHHKDGSDYTGDFLND